MAETLAAVTATPAKGFATRRLALGNTGVALKITLPTWARQVTVRFFQTDGTTVDSGKVAEDATDGAAIGDNAYPVSSGSSLSWRVHPLLEPPSTNPIIYVAPGSNSGYVHLLLEQEA